MGLSDLEQVVKTIVAPREVGYGGALISPCGTYRYVLGRVWDPAIPLAVFVMLNPSTADAVANDPTIGRCIGFARAWGNGGIVVVNAYALRSTDPRALAKAADPVGPDNDAAIAAVLTANAAAGVNQAVIAWGSHAMVRLTGRGRQVLDLLRAQQVTPMCLGMTSSGFPRHPLYLRADTALVPFAGDDCELAPAAVGGAA